MSLFWKAAAAVLIAVVLILMLGKQAPDMGLMISIAASTMVAILAVTYLEPVLEFLQELEVLSRIQGDMLGVLLKAVGIGLVVEITGTICADAGNASLGKTLQLLGSAVILCLSVPVLRSMLDLVQMILGEL